MYLSIALQLHVFQQCAYCSTPHLPGNILTLDDLGLLLEELVVVCTKWYNLGLQLKLGVTILDRIRQQFSDPRDQLLEMLLSWLHVVDKPSWKTLTDALRSRSVGASVLAGVLEAKYCRLKDTLESKH